MEKTRQVTPPEELHSDLRETRKEVAAVAETADAEITEEIATEATVRAGGRIEEAERWDGVSASDEAIQELMTRGVVDIVVREEFEKKLRSGRKLRVKLGIDPTGPLLHIGRSVPLFKLRQFQDMGHQIVLIIGDFTAIVGDASDKDAQRVMLTRDQIERNMETYKEQIGHVLDLDKVEFRYNSQWLAPLTFNDVIRLASKFTVAQMIQRDNFSDRWDAGKPIGLHELLYPLMQGFDSVAIEADVEIGGTDQLFNLMAGRALQEDFGQPPQTVITLNMIEGPDGRKMSTSWGNVILLLDEPRDQFGKIMSMADHVLPVYLEAVTPIPMSEVKEMTRQLDEGSINPMEIKKRLGWEVVKMYHGEAAANQAREDFERQFQRGELPTQIPIVPLERALAHKASEDGTIGILDLLVNVGLAPSRKHAQRLVEQGGVRVDDEPVKDRESTLKPTGNMIIKAGRSFVKIEG
jgi:tyrosyl-tRNA synthetase